MKETDFIKQNKKKWEDFEQILLEKNRDPDKLSKLFIEITDDLSYSRTFYPLRSITVCLNSLAQQGFSRIYKTKTTRMGTFIDFWKNELPAVVYECRKEFSLSLIIFLCSIIIGVISSANDSGFIRTILGDAYVEMTIENIDSGDPMAVYKKKNSMEMFLGITFNNIMVSFRVFIFGIFIAIGSIVMMIYNGVMLGSFQYFFYEKGLFYESFLTIWQHGTLEISAVVIAGAGGITLGKGLAFPGNYSRIQSLIISARKGIKILLGTIPIFFCAAIIEGFLTRYTETPDVIRALLIIFSLSFIIFYFVLRPRKIGPAKQKERIDKARLGTTILQEINIDTIKSNAQIFSDTFIFYKKLAGKIALVAVALAVVYTAIILLFLPESFLSCFENTPWSLVNLKNYFFVYEIYPIMFVINTVFFAITIFTINMFCVSVDDSVLQSKATGFKLARFFSFDFLYVLFLSAMLNLLFVFAGRVFLLLSLLAIPFIVMSTFVLQKERTRPVVAIKRMFALLTKSYWKLLGLFFIILLLCVIYFVVIDSPLLWAYFQFLSWNILADEVVLEKLFLAVSTFLTFFGLAMILPLIGISIALMYYSLVEINEANFLKNKVNDIF